MHIKFRNAVYTPIPKVACTTLKHEVLKIVDYHRKMEGKRLISFSYDISDIHLFFNHAAFFHIEEKDIQKENLFHFIFIRNPYDRVVSAYFNKINNHSRRLGDKTFAVGGVTHHMIKADPRLKGGVSFPYFISILKENILVRENQHFIPQSWFLSPSGWDNVGLVGRFETLNQDWEQICRVMNIPYRTLDKLNVSTVNKNYRDIITPSSRKIIDELYKEDLERFKYSF